MTTNIVAYQGISGSNSEMAAKQLAWEARLPNPQFLPKTTSAGVVEALENNEAHFGVVALQNSTAGVVEETTNALRGFNHRSVARSSIRIVHCLFSLQDDTLPNITQVYSHPQALAQCSKTLDVLLPNASRTEEVDTALAAEKLRSGAYPAHSAVICSREAGHGRGLKLLRDNINNRPDNYTTFQMICASADIPSPSPEVETLMEKTWKYLGTNGISKALGWAVSIVIFVAFFLTSYFSLNAWKSALFVGTPIALALMLLIRGKFHVWLAEHRFGGYWEYYLSRDGDHGDQVPILRQEPELRRLVHVETRDKKLRMDGWKCFPFPEAAHSLFKTNHVLVSDLLGEEGVLTYWYVSHESVSPDADFAGVVNLIWTCKIPWKKVNHLEGWYSGRRTREIGKISFSRITREQFELAHQRT